jgi:hypothetical protein
VLQGIAGLGEETMPPDSGGPSPEQEGALDGLQRPQTTGTNVIVHDVDTN